MLNVKQPLIVFSVFKEEIAKFSPLAAENFLLFNVKNINNKNNKEGTLTLDSSMRGHDRLSLLNGLPARSHGSDRERVPCQRRRFLFNTSGGERYS